MNKQDIKKLISLGLCLVLFVCFSLAVPDFWGYDISYKNEKLDQHIPAQADQQVSDITFTLPVLYIHSYNIKRLMPDWKWTEGGPTMPEREESSVDIYLFDRGENNINDIPTHIYHDEMM